jgi:hypothetical protein
MANIWEDDFAGELSLSEKALRNEFVKQYLIDFDEFKACLRLGFNRAFAEQWATTFMSEPYVQKKISEQTLQTPDDEQKQEEADKQLTLAVLRQAAQHGPYSSRVAAAAKLAAILGMDKPIQSSLEITNRGGVMVVPGIGNVDDWEEEAVRSQEELIAAARLH